MNRLLVAAAASAVLVTGAHAADLLGPGVVETAAPAAPAMSGDLTVYGGAVMLDDQYEDYQFSGGLFGGAGRVNVMLTPEMSAQFDLSAETVFSEEDDDHYGLINLATHLSWRQEGYLLGVYGGVSAEADWWDAILATGGVEGQAVVGDHLILSGQAGYTATISSDGDDPAAAHVRGAVTYFLNPNMSVSANLGAYHETYDGGSDEIEGLTWGAAAEYQFDGSPFSIFVAYQGGAEQEDEGDIEKWNYNAILGGIRVSFGEGSLEDAAKNGANQRDYNPLTGFRHALFNNYE